MKIMAWFNSLHDAELVEVYEFALLASRKEYELAFLEPSLKEFANDSFLSSSGAVVIYQAEGEPTLEELVKAFVKAWNDHIKII